MPLLLPAPPPIPPPLDCIQSTSSEGMFKSPGKVMTSSCTKSAAARTATITPPKIYFEGVLTNQFGAFTILDRSRLSSTQISIEDIDDPVPVPDPFAPFKMP